MKPQPFFGGADGPDAVIDVASDGTPLKDLRGWECWNCETLYATWDEADACCVAPVPHVVVGEP
jgi:hypothetical protein